MTVFNDKKEKKSIKIWFTRKILSYMQKEEIKYKNTIKQYENDQLWQCYKRKHKQT